RPSGWFWRFYPVGRITPLRIRYLTTSESEMPEISRTTVCPVLETCVRIAVVRKACHPGTAARYELETYQNFPTGRGERVGSGSNSLNPSRGETEQGDN